MTTQPWTDHDDPQTASAPGRGYGWSDRAGRKRNGSREWQRHAGIGTREEVERLDVEEVEEEEDRHGTAERRPRGTAAKRNGSGTARRNGGTDERNGSGTAQRNDDRAGSGVPDRHEIVVPDEDDRAVDLADDDEDYVPRQPLVHNLRFVNEPLGSLRDLLRFAREAHYNMSHIPLVRAFHIVFFWLVTTPVLTTSLFLLWAFAVRLHRAITAVVFAVVFAPAVRTIPVVGWLIPEWLVVSTWSATTWQWVGGGVLVFGVGTAIVMAGERRR